MNIRGISIDKGIYLRPMEGNNAQTLNIQLFLPPSDVPTKLETRYDNNSDVYEIRFEYGSEEPQIKIIDHDEYSLNVGKYSHKAMLIQIKNARKQNIQEIVLRRIFKQEVSDFIKDNLSNSNMVRDRTNLLRAGELLEKNAPELLVSVA